MAVYDWVLFTPQGAAPATPAKNEIYYASGDDRLYLCPDGTGAGGGAYSDLRFSPQGAAPAAAKGKTYVSSSDDHLYVCTAV